MREQSEQEQKEKEENEKNINAWRAWADKTFDMNFDKDDFRNTFETYNQASIEDSDVQHVVDLKEVLHSFQIEKLKAVSMPLEDVDVNSKNDKQHVAAILTSLILKSKKQKDQDVPLDDGEASGSRSRNKSSSSSDADLHLIKEFYFGLILLLSKESE